MLIDKNIIVFLVAMLPIFITCNAQEIEKKLQHILDSTYQANQNAVGLLIHVESPNKNISWTSAIGFSNKDTKEKIDKDQPLLIASNTKTYVSAAILKLVENGKLELNQPIKISINEKYPWKMPVKLSLFL